MHSSVNVSNEVRDALVSGLPVVAIDTTIFGQAGLGGEWPEGYPSEPYENGPNQEALTLVTNELMEGGVEPALTAVIDGSCRVGISDDEYPMILNTDNKAGTDHLREAVNSRITATTTISSALYLAEQVGIRVLSTSGIGGVHVNHSDRSSDLEALASHTVVTVAAGMKTFLDREATLDALKDLDVPVIGWQTQDCPAFYSRTSGLKIASVETAEELCRLALFRWQEGKPGGLLLAVPIPTEHDIPLLELEPVIEEANADIEVRGIEGSRVTPEVLKYMRSRVGNRLVISNLALAQNNAKIAAKIAATFVSLSYNVIPTP